MIKGFLRIRRETVIARGSKVPVFRVPGLGWELSWFVGIFEGSLRLNFFLSLPLEE